MAAFASFRYNLLKTFRQQYRAIFVFNRKVVKAIDGFHTASKRVNYIKTAQTSSIWEENASAAISTSGSDSFSFCNYQKA